MPTTSSKSQKTMNKPVPWYEMNSTKAGEAEITIYDVIGGNWFGDGLTGKRFVEDLKNLPDHQTLNIYINSPGGSVYDGRLIYNALKRHKAHKKVTIDGMAASMASVIAMVGDEIIMPENAMMMVHDPSMCLCGNSRDMREAADYLDKSKKTLISAYRDKTGLDDDVISELMADETWMTADEAIEKGFADKTTDAVEMAAMAFDLSNYRNVPEFLKKADFNLSPPIKTGSNIVINEGDLKVMPISMDQLKNEAPELITQLKNEGKQEALTELDKVKADARNEGAEQERKRIQAIEDLHTAGYESIVNDCKFDGKTQAPDVAMKILAAQKQAQSNTLTNLQNDAPKPVNADVQDAETVQNGPDPLKDKTALTLDEAKKLYAEDDRVKKAFTSAENFYYYRKNLK